MFKRASVSRALVGRMILFPLSISSLPRKEEG